MTSASLAPPRRTPVFTPGRALGSIAHLAALGIIGPGLIGAVATLFGTGLGMLPVLGIGAVLLVGCVYVLFGLGWFEIMRLEGLYGFGLAPLQPRQRVRAGFSGVLLMFWHQAIDRRMWRALATLAIAIVFGLVLIPFASGIVVGIAIAFAPLYASGPVDAWGIGFGISLAWAPLIGGLISVISIAAVVGLGLMHGAIARSVHVSTRAAQLERVVRTSDAQRVGAIRASEVERTRIERDLHDGVQPRLVSVGMTLGLAQQKIENDPDAAKALIEEAHTSTKAAITELRQLARGIHASVLDDRGLDAALSALAARSHVPVLLDVRLDGRCSKTAETAVYFAIAESLTNAAKHSRANECRVTVRLRDENTLWARVEDNGMGGARVLPGGGLDGISNRVLGVGGTVRLDSPNGGPTSLEVSVPCAS